MTAENKYELKYIRLEYTNGNMPCHICVLTFNVLEYTNGNMPIFKCIKCELKCIMGYQDDAIEYNRNLKIGVMPILEYKLEYSNIDTSCIIQ